jgi:D-alanyl-D-alanine carboxypeptidase/D-alanyl-D-alanine-endopeptidase (penicillin-binding protein 4)
MMMAIQTIVWLAVGLATSRPAGDARPDPLASAVAALKVDKAVEGLDVGVAVRCVDANSPVIGSGSERLMNPASGTKLLTTAAALAAFGADHRFATRAFGHLERDGKVAGPLVIVPAGDPSFQVQGFSELGKALMDAGVRHVPNGIVVDLGGFPLSDVPPAFDQKKTDAAYRPLVPPLAAFDGAITVTVKPGPKVGDPVRVTMNPAGRTIELVNSATTAAGKAIDKLEITTAHRAGGTSGEGMTQVIVRGTLGQKAPAQGARKRLQAPLATAVDELLRAMRKAGITVETIAVSRTPVNNRGPELASASGATVAEIISTINIHSNNFWAEALFRLLDSPDGGQARTWERAAAAVGKLLGERFGLARGEFRIVNGSGLYDATHITPRAMTALLSAHAGDDDTARAFRASLARAGETGTLRKRLKSLKGRVSAKTGTLDAALSLSGFIAREGACTLAFSAMVGGEIGERAGRVNGAIDRFVMALAKR